MKLLPREIDKLALVQAGLVAQRRLARGKRLNHVEATALICTVLLEHVRDGESAKTVASIGEALLGKRLVLDSVPFLIGEVQLEGTFPDGTKLITVHNPIATIDGNLEAALYGSFLPVPSIDMFPAMPASNVIEPGIPLI